MEKSTQNEVPGEIGGPVATVPMVLTREADFKRLVGEGFISSRATQDKTRERVEQERDRASQRERQTQLTASVAGIIQHLAIHSVGGVVTSAQPLMIVVPVSPTATAEITIANQDISFVYAGQRRRSSWKPTVYQIRHRDGKSGCGDAPGEVADEKKGSYYPATLTLSQKDMLIDGKRVNLSPGMNITAEIKTRRRRIIEF